MKLRPHDPGYPERLCHLDEPPDLVVSGPLEGDRVVAIVGSRQAIDGSKQLAFQLAYHLARAGVTVVSGGAVGVDRLAHEGAMKAGGATWLVSPAGRGVIYPAANEDLFRAIEQSPTSRIIWPFPDGKPKDANSPRFRNAVLVGLAECVVVIQASLRSGSRNAARRARELGRPVYVVPGMPNTFEFEGSMAEGAEGAIPFWSIEWFFEQLGLPPPDLGDPNALWGGRMPLRVPRPRRRCQPQTYSSPPLFPVELDGWTREEKLVFSNLSAAPIHQDELVTRTGLPTSSTLTALLTLSLKDVVVEGPDGFFRRRVGT